MGTEYEKTWLLKHVSQSQPTSEQLQNRTIASMHRSEILNSRIQSGEGGKEDEVKVIDTFP
jgi:hypothetical protein